MELREGQLREVLDLARFLSSRSERAEWDNVALESLQNAYGEDEPEYTEGDVKPGEDE